MYAIEFETDANGRMIEIPQEYEALASKHLKVIIMFDDLKQLAKSKKPASAITLTTLNDELNEEVANEHEAFFSELRTRHLVIEKNIDIDQLMQDMNNGLR